MNPRDPRWKTAERLVMISGPENKAAAERIFHALHDVESFDGLIEKAYFRALADGDDRMAKHLSSSFMSPEKARSVKEKLVNEVKHITRALVPEGGEE